MPSEMEPLLKDIPLSDTPKCDGQEFTIHGPLGEQLPNVVYADFARQLERDLSGLEEWRRRALLARPNLERDIEDALE